MLVDGFARTDWKYFFNLASGAQGWQREDAEQEAGEGFPAPRLVPFLGRRCGRRGESVWHSKGPLRLMLVTRYGPLLAALTGDTPVGGGAPCMTPCAVRYPRDRSMVRSPFWLPQKDPRNTTKGYLEPVLTMVCVLGVCLAISVEQQSCRVSRELLGAKRKPRRAIRIAAGYRGELG